MRVRSTKTLAPWQARRAEELLLAATDGGCTVEVLARACRLSRSQFAHSFKASTGVPPHRWLVLRRVQLARMKMESTTESLALIAASCGFADQSHFTRTFHSVMGCSPAAWRRERILQVATAAPVAIIPTRPG